MKLLKEFKEFAIKGNALDLAVGVVIGAAFGKIVSSLVADVIMPPLGVIIGGIDFSNFAITLKEATGDAPAVTLNYGRFLQSMLDFTIIAFAIFMLVKGINSLRRLEEIAPREEIEPVMPPRLTKEQELLMEIRDLLKK